jgi:hypothetical protein
VGTIGGAIIGSSAQKKASSQANDTQQAATQAQLQLGQQSLAVQQQLAQQSLALQDKLAGQGLAANLGIYNSNYGMLSPFVSRGNVAGDAINALLGLPTAPVMTSPMANGIPSFPGINAPAAGAPATPTPAAPAGPAAPAQQQSLDQWATGALNALLPNITQPDNIAAINAAGTPMAKLQAALAISPPTSDQYPAYAAYRTRSLRHQLPLPPRPQPQPQQLRHSPQRQQAERLGSGALSSTAISTWTLTAPLAGRHPHNPPRKRPQHRKEQHPCQQPQHPARTSPTIAGTRRDTSMR